MFFFFCLFLVCFLNLSGSSSLFLFIVSLFYSQNIHTGASPTSEDLQCKDNVHFPPQKYDGATKNEGYFRQGPKQDPTLSDGRNGNTLNKVRNTRFSDIQKMDLQKFHLTSTRNIKKKKKILIAFDGK